MQYDVEASLGDMIVHGLFSINLFSLLVLLGCAVGMAEVVSDTLGQEMCIRDSSGPGLLLAEDLPDLPEA